MPYITAWFKASEVTCTVLLNYFIMLQSLKMLQDVCIFFIQQLTLLYHFLLTHA